MLSTDQKNDNILKDVEMIERGSLSNLDTIVPGIDPQVEARLVRKIDIRLMPFTALIYLLCYLDRSNIGNAKIMNSTTHDTLLDSTGMDSSEYIVALMVFIVAYTIFEAPSNLALKVFSPNIWLGFLVIGFGSICCGLSQADDFATITVLRFFLGAFEAGVFPGMIFYMSFWYKPEERATRIAVFLSSATLSGAFGGAIAYGVGHINDARGLEGWRWLFLVEGVPSIAVGIAVAVFMPKYPESSSWLSQTEKELQLLRLGENCSKGSAELSWTDAKDALSNVTLWMHYIAYLCLGVGVSSVSLFAPTIVAGLGYEDLQAQLFTVPPYAIAYVVTLVMGIVSDRLKMRGIIASSCFAVGAISFIIQAALPATSFTARYAFLCIGTAGVFGGLPSLCAWVSDNVRNTTAASLASALNIAVAGPGQIIGVWIYREQDKPGYVLGHAVNAGFLSLGAIISLGLWWHYARLNRNMVGTGATRWIS